MLEDKIMTYTIDNTKTLRGKKKICLLRPVSDKSPYPILSVVQAARAPCLIGLTTYVSKEFQTLIHTVFRPSSNPMTTWWDISVTYLFLNAVEPGKSKPVNSKQLANKDEDIPMYKEF